MKGIGSFSSSSYPGGEGVTTSSFVKPKSLQNVGEDPIVWNLKPFRFYFWLTNQILFEVHVDPSEPDYGLPWQMAMVITILGRDTIFSPD